jgi:hypothetical protein
MFRRHYTSQGWLNSSEIVFLMGFRGGAAKLLVPQSDQRIDMGGAARRQVACQHGG